MGLHSCNTATEESVLMKVDASNTESNSADGRNVRCREKMKDRQLWNLFELIE